VRELDTPDSSVVRLRDQGDYSISWGPIFAVLLSLVVSMLSIGQLLYGLIVEHWSWPVHSRQFTSAILVGGGVAANACTVWLRWRHSVIDVALSAKSLTISTRAKQTVLPLDDLVSCHVFCSRAFRLVKVRLVLKMLGETEWVEVIVKRKMDPLTDLQLLPDLQRRGVEIIGVEHFVQEIERFTGKSAAGLFNDPRTLQAGGPA